MWRGLSDEKQPILPPSAPQSKHQPSYPHYYITCMTGSGMLGSRESKGSMMIAKPLG